LCVCFGVFGKFCHDVDIVVERAKAKFFSRNKFVQNQEIKMNNQAKQ